MKKDFTVFLIIWAVTAAYFIIQTFSDIYTFALSVAFAVLATISFVVLLQQKADEIYYANLTLSNLLLTILTALLMLVVGAAFSMPITGKLILGTPLTALVNPSSLLTSLLSELLFTFALVATAEELLKLAAYAELKSRYNIYVAIVVAVGTWSGYHALQAYDNILLIIPAFISGVILIGLLEHTKALLAVVFAHGTYNGVIIFIGYIINPPEQQPIFPTAITPADIALVALTILWAVFVLLPVLRKGNGSY